MITAELKATTPPKESITFPCLCQDTDSEAVVLFTSPKEGMVVTPSRIFALGHYSDDWVPASDAREWTNLPPGTEVTLKVS